MKTLTEEARNRAARIKTIVLCFLLVMFALGFCSSPHSWFINYIVPYLDVPESLYAIVKSIRYVTTAIVNLFFAFFVAKLGTKKLIIAGLASLALSMLCNALATNLVLVYLGGFFLGLGLAWTTTTIVAFIVNLWCKENRGTVMGAILASNGLGATLATLTIKPVITKSATSFKQAYIIVAIIMAVLALLFLFLYKEKKPSADELPQKGQKKKAKRGRVWSGIEYKKIVRKPYFYLSLLCIFLSGLVLQSITGVAVPHMEAVGLSAEFVSVTIVVNSITLTVFKFLTGFMYDKLGPRVTTGICMLTGVGVMVALASVTNSPAGMVFALLYSAFASLALPLETIMLPIYANDLFGEKAYILNDDKPALRLIEGIWYAYGTPWSGKHDISVNTGVPIGGICMLERGEENKIIPFRGKDAIFELFVIIFI